MTAWFFLVVCLVQSNGIGGFAANQATMVGPFKSQEQCEEIRRAVRAQCHTSVCWDGPVR